ncbi:MAG: low molecular weight phosphotyrosine protein phosphatase, partial [Flavobacteriales bacterium]|nr:low molecular weight phosphotyrosine protein phosphatase [Flavobacteriales bacterium]
EAPDRRAIATMRRFGIDISDLRARQVSAQDFARFDHLLAMDEENLLDLRALAP